MVQPKDLSYSAHGQPLVRRRDALPKLLRECTAGGCSASLSSGTQTSCAVPVRTAKVIRFPPESPVTTRRNRRSLCAGNDHVGSESARTKSGGCPVACSGVLPNFRASLDLAIEERGRNHESWSAPDAVIRVCYIFRHVHGDTDGSHTEDWWWFHREQHLVVSVVVKSPHAVVHED